MDKIRYGERIAEMFTLLNHILGNIKYTTRRFHVTNYGMAWHYLRTYDMRDGEPARMDQISKIKRSS